MTNLVEFFADEEECAFDQPCEHGHRVEHHSVYCHNETWRDAPRKCKRTWYWGRGADKELQDEACPGFKPNLDYVEQK